MKTQASEATSPACEEAKGLLRMTPSINETNMGKHQLDFSLKSATVSRQLMQNFDQRYPGEEVDKLIHPSSLSIIVGVIGMYLGVHLSPLELDIGYMMRIDVDFYQPHSPSKKTKARVLQSTPQLRSIQKG